MNSNNHGQALELLEIECDALTEMVGGMPQCMDVRLGRTVCDHRSCGNGTQCARAIRRTIYDLMEQVHDRLDIEHEALTDAAGSIVLRFLATSNCNKALDGLSALAQTHHRDAARMECRNA